MKSSVDPFFSFDYTHEGKVYTGYFGAASFKDAVERLPSIRENARVVGELVSRRYSTEGEHDE